MEPETEKEQRERCLEELKGKNIAHYSVLLTAWIQTKMEHDKTLVTLSAAGIGLLLTIINLTGVWSLISVVFFVGAFAGFLVTIACVLVIYERNSSHIEHELRGGERRDFKLKQLDRFLKWSFMFGAVCGIFGATILTWSKQMAEQNKSTSQQVQESLQGIENLAPKEQFKSLSGIENLRPPSSTEAPTSQTPAPTGTGETPPQSGQGAGDKSSSD